MDVFKIKINIRFSQMLSCHLKMVHEHGKNKQILMKQKWNKKKNDTAKNVQFSIWSSVKKLNK